MTHPLVDLQHDAGIVGELLVVADEHSHLVIVDTDVGLYHLLSEVWQTRT